MFVSDPLFDAVLRGLILASAAITWVVILVRINGLRSFSKMTSFDFVMTVAIGSLLAGAGQATEVAGFLQPLLAMLALFVFQHVVARFRFRSGRFRDLVQNRPVLLMRDGVIFERALAETRVSKGDLVAKLRESNVLDLTEVRAAVLETTGDISVLHGDACAEDLLEGVRSVER
ncbi:YetF domain-containing protein [Halomonas denitrificans]|nr:DUF421 domain-containing protein [Halomonas denitrificans]